MSDSRIIRSVSDLTIKKKTTTDITSNLKFKRQNIKNKKLKASSKDWISRHINDPFVIASKKQGYISRAVYKLIDIDDKFKILKNAKNILDLGSAPGSWLQIIDERLKSEYKNLIGVDILDIQFEHKKVIKIKGDFNDDEVRQKISDICKSFDLILSDISPNKTGMREHDNINMSNILNEIIDFSLLHIVPGGCIIMKAFHGAIENDMLLKIKKSFKNVKHFKPITSRSESSEIYLVCQGFIKK
jgi:23S rRNA (uridine2552-2'-O)-methyltransferase